MRLVAVSMIFFPFAATPMADPGAGWRSAERAARGVYEQITELGADFADMAQRWNPDAPSAGFLGLVPGADWVARRIPPEAYAVARLPDRRNPIVIIQDPALRQAVDSLAREGDVPEPVALADGYALLRRGAAYDAPSFDLVEPYLRAWAMDTALERLVADRLQAARWHWSPLER